MSTVNFDKLLEAFEFASFSGGIGSSAYVDLETGHIYWVAEEMDDFEEVPDDIETSDRYLMLPAVTSQFHSLRNACRMNTKTWSIVSARKAPMRASRIFSIGMML